MKRIISLSFVLLLTACGGGGGGTANVIPSVALHVTSAVNGGTPCVGVINTDAMFGNILDWALPLNEPSWGCNVVSSTNGYPVASGTQSMRFENRPTDCPAQAPDLSYPLGWRDCEQDRSRNEVIEKLSVGSSSGQLITYEYKIYIPRQERFRPNGDNLLVLTQIRFSDLTGCNPAGALAYLIAMPNDKLGIRIHKDWSWDSVGDVTINTEPIYDRWISIKWEILATDNNNGYLKVWVDGSLVASAMNRPTIPTNDGVIRMKYGIYNSFKSRATEPYSNQVVYFDDIVKTIK